MNKRILTMNTLAFTVCFACWMMNGVLVTFLVKNGAYHWSQAQIGWLIGIPVLTGSLTRLPVGILTDKYGGRAVYSCLMLISALAMFAMSFADSFSGFVLGGLGFGLTGASFAVGVAYTCVWFSKERQGTALGLFGVGNIGAAFTSMGAPFLLLYLTDHGANLDGWRSLPRFYAAALVIMTLFFYGLTKTKVLESGQSVSLAQRLAPLRNPRVWRFGLYYFYVFGGFVALAQWLIPYYVNAYGMTIATAGLMAAIFSLPSSIIRAGGGWMSDHWGARRVMYVILTTSLIITTVLIIPGLSIFVFAPLIFTLAIVMGIGMAAVYKHIPSYFPNDVGIVGGLVGLIGGLGGFFLPLLFGYLLKITKLQTSCWAFFAILIAASLLWMHRVIQKMTEGPPPLSLRAGESGVEHV